MDVGKRIRSVRQQRGMSLRDLARRSGVSKAYLSQLENNPDRKPSIDVVVRIASALGVPLLELIEAGPTAHLGPPGARVAGEAKPEGEMGSPWATSESDGDRPRTPLNAGVLDRGRATAEAAAQPGGDASPRDSAGTGEPLGLGDTAATVEPDQLPWALRLFWEEHPDVSPAEVQSLAAITWCGRRPFTPTDYWVLYQVLSGMMRGR